MHWLCTETNGGRKLEGYDAPFIIYTIQIQCECIMRSTDINMFILKDRLLDDFNLVGNSLQMPKAETQKEGLPGLSLLLG